LLPQGLFLDTAAGLLHPALRASWFLQQAAVNLCYISVMSSGRPAGMPDQRRLVRLVDPEGVTKTRMSENWQVDRAAYYED